MLFKTTWLERNEGRWNDKPLPSVPLTHLPALQERHHRMPFLPLVPVCLAVNGLPRTWRCAFQCVFIPWERTPWQLFSIRPTSAMFHFNHCCESLHWDLLLLNRIKAHGFTYRAGLCWCVWVCLFALFTQWNRLSCRFELHLFCT